MNPLVARVTTAINALLHSADSFTVLDISNAVKKDGDNFVSHQTVRDIARPILDTLIVGRGYKATPIDVQDKHGDLAVAILYHPYSVDPQSYANRQNAALSPSDLSAGSNASGGGTATMAAPAAAIAAPKIAAHLGHARSAKQVRPRSDGGIEVPASILEAAGLNEGDAVTVTIHPNSVGIEADQNGTRFIGTNGIRVSYSALVKCGLHGKNLLNVAAFGSKVVISQ